MRESSGAKMTDTSPLAAIGIMSGTSRDGLDAAMIVSDGERVFERLGFLSRPYDESFRERLASASARVAASLGDSSFADLEEEFSERCGSIVESLLSLAGRRVDVVGLHGHTLLHAPERGVTVQLGDGAATSRRVGIDVVWDFRSADVADGGQGAPLAPMYHLAVSRSLSRDSFPVAFVNVGGVSNVTWISDVGVDDSSLSGRMSAFDVGAGNAPLDDWARRHTGMSCDVDGRLASRGRADESRIESVLSDSYFGLSPPKSLDRDSLSSSLESATRGLSAEDGAAVLTEIISAGIARSVEFMPRSPRLWLVSGGGRLNPSLMSSLGRRLGVEPLAIESVGLNGDAIEAEAFAFFAVRRLRGLPLTHPCLTGASSSLLGGRVSLARETILP